MGQRRVPPPLGIGPAAANALMGHFAHDDLNKKGMGGAKGSMGNRALEINASWKRPAWRRPGD